MKTPEKIYLYPYSTDGIYEVETKPLEGTVEYIRTDAFVEKAYEYLSYHLDTSKIDVNYKFDFIEEFRKYLKGE